MARKRSGLERMVGALTSGVILGALWWFHILSPGWAVGLGVVFVALPLLGGLRRSVRELADRGHERRQALLDREQRQLERQDNLEKQVLQVAQAHGGVVTAAQVVLNTDLKLDEAEKILETMAARGHAEMRLQDNGAIDYRFHGLK